jgi:PAS domain S-box-containing protein
MTKVTVLSRTHALAAIAVAAFLFFLGFTALRLVQVGNDLRDGGTESYIWLTSQAQYEGVLFGESLARQMAGEEFKRDQDRPSHRFDIFMSRLDTLFGGPLEHQLGLFGLLDDIRRHYTNLLDAEPLKESGPSSLDQIDAIRTEVTPLVRSLRDATNRFVVLERNERGAARDTLRHIILEIMASVIGILVSGAILILRVVKGIRDARTADRLLRQEKEFSDLVVTLSDQGIVIFDKSLTALLWNPGMEALLGVRATEVLGRPLDAAASLFRRRAVHGAMLKAADGVSTTVEDDSWSLDELARCLEISCHPLRISERDLVVAFVRDVTARWEARKQAERQNVDLERTVEQRTAALHQAESRLIAAINTAPDGFAAFDAEGKLLIANERIRSVEPIASGCREGMSLSVFLSCFAPCEGADRKLLTIGSAFEAIELDLRLQEDSWAHLSVTRVDGGTIFVRLTDVTPYKKAALALQSSLDRERETTSAYRSFVSMVSHQFRTPLAIIDSSAQRLLRRSLAVPQEELASRVQKIRSATSRLTSLVDGVLNAAKLDAGRIELNIAPCDLVDVVAEVCERQRELNPQIDIRLEAPSCGVEVCCDGMLIEQAFSNLLSNAVKYSGGASRVEIQLGADDANVSCSVRDWGIGIPADDLSKVFDRFYRARTAGGIAGTGLGLNFARHIMRMHGGDIEVESREGEGSIFTLSMPISSAAQATQAA